jgi:hypothetical protein
MSDKTWLYGLTADEWLHLASEGGDSEVQPCCGNTGLVRDILNSLATMQGPEDMYTQKFLGRELLSALEADGDGHGLQDPQLHPLLHRVIAGVNAQTSKEK